MQKYICLDGTQKKFLEKLSNDELRKELVLKFVTKLRTFRLAMETNNPHCFGMLKPISLHVTPNSHLLKPPASGAWTEAN